MGQRISGRRRRRKVRVSGVCSSVEFDGVEVEEVGFDGEGVGAEGGAVADVGDGFEGLGCWAGAYREGGDVDAVGGEELVRRGRG